MKLVDRFHLVANQGGRLELGPHGVGEIDAFQRFGLTHSAGRRKLF